MSNAFFVTGTDTGIGKTLCAVALLKVAGQTGLSTLGLKPVAAGCEETDGVWMNDDARELMLASSVKPEYATVNPAALREPMAPHIAAERDGVTLDAAILAHHCLANLDSADFCLIEGAGGWDVPLNSTESMADLASAIGCPVILVAGMRLGCINHSLLTAGAIRQQGLQLAGWIANHIDPDMDVADENVEALTDRLDAPLLGRIPWLRDKNDACKHLSLPASA
jgi:dethiobiotin synthetase